MLHRTQVRTPRVTPSTSDEQQYLNLVKNILRNGENRDDRTGTGTKAIFAPAMLKFDLSKRFPLLTTRKLPFSSIVHELLWFLSGSTNVHDLQKHNVTIWNANAADYAEKYPGSLPGELNAIYGFNWRHFGAHYVDCQTDYTGKGVDQIKNIIDLIQNDPFSRRIVLCAWNPATNDQCALPACHMLCQFFVSYSHVTAAATIPAAKQKHSLKFMAFHKKYEDVPMTVRRASLNCLLTMRSSDTALGLPFNIAGYALLVHMIAHVCKMSVGTLSVSLGDAHIYNDHVEAMEILCKRSPMLGPRISFKSPSGGGFDALMRMKREDIVLDEYLCHQGIKMKMSV